MTTIAEFIDEHIQGEQPAPFEARFTRTADGHAVLDLFAGSGVGVAIQKLGAKEYGVEIMPEAVATRAANGMETVYRDAWDIDKARGLEFDTLWASPPCQTFSMAGKGAGREALDNVLETVKRGDWKNIGALRYTAKTLGDERIGLVLTPLAYVYRYRPTFVAFEQVPPVLPVWEAMAGEMRELGYSVWTGYLHSEQYGVPQARKRAYLIARSDGKEAKPPKPTHSKYYARTPEKIDPGTQKWVSMAEGLGRGLTERPGYTIAGGGVRDADGVGGHGPDSSFSGGASARKGMRQAVEAGEWK